MTGAAPDNKPERDKPRIRIVPPKLAALFLVVGIILNFLLPLRPFGYWASFFIGLFILPAGAALVAWSIRTFAMHGTNVRIDRPATALVTAGPYALSRNPVYLGGAVAYAGIALLFNAGWALLFLGPLLVIIHKRVVLPEEAYLENKFGAAYLDYKSKVRRWI